MKNKKILTKNYKKEYQELNKILNEWDFIGVVDEDNQDEYSDLINPILNNLEKDIKQKGLAEFIVNFVAQRYGMSPTGTFEVSEKILTWWKRN